MEIPLNTVSDVQPTSEVGKSELFIAEPRKSQIEYIPPRTGTVVDKEGVVHSLLSIPREFLASLLEKLRQFVLEVGLGTKAERAEVTESKRLMLKYYQGGEEVHFRSSDGVKLEGMFCSAKNDKGIPPSGKTILVCTGSHQSYERQSYPIVEALRKEGHNVFVFNYRGFGNSEGEPTEEGICDDADAAYQYLKSRGATDESLIVYGYSLGSAPATDLAVNHPVNLVLDRPFASMDQVASDQIWYVPVLPRVLCRQFAHFDNVAKIGKVQKEVFIIQGTKDATMTTVHGDKLLKAARAGENKRPIRVEIPIKHEHYDRDDYWFSAVNMTEPTILNARSDFSEFLKGAETVSIKTTETSTL